MTAHADANRIGRGESGSHFAEHGLALWVGWIGASVAGELIGLTLVAAMGGLVMLAFGEPAGAFAALASAFTILAGGFEGAIVGAAQMMVVRHVFPSIQPAAWIRATALGAAIAWALGLSAGTFAESAALASLSPFTMAALTIVVAGALGAVVGFAQWTVLRGHLERAPVWIAANAFGWSLGATAAFRGMSCVPPCRTLVRAVTIGATTGVVSGLLVGIVTASALVALLRLARPRAHAT